MITSRYRRFILLPAVALLALSVLPGAILAAPDNAAVRAPQAAAAVSGRTLLRQSMTAVSRSLRYVHFEIALTVTQGNSHAWIHAGGGSSMSPEYMISRLWVGGSANVNGKVQNVATRAVSDFTPGPGIVRLWERTNTTGAKWQRVNAQDAAPLFLFTSPALLAQSGTAGLQALHIKNLGATWIRGHHVWHIRTTAWPRLAPSTRFLHVDFFIDQTTHYWVRVVAQTAVSGQSVLAVINYAHFNRPIDISIPMVG